MKLHRGLMSISDFAAYCGSTRQTMQYYDRIGLLDPLQVTSKGYRYYHPLQGHEFRLIQCLQRSGCSLEEVEDILDSADIEVLQTRLEEKQRVLEQELRRIRREQVYLERFAQFLSWAGKNPLEKPTLFPMGGGMRFYEIPFDAPCAPYSDEYYNAVLHFAEFYRNNSSIQVYPYFLYVSREELFGERRFCKLLCLYEENAEQMERTFITRPGSYLCMRAHPERADDIRNPCYETMFRFMDAHGLEPAGGSVEMPFCIPPGLRKSEYRFSVVFLIPVASKEKEGGGNA